MADAENRDAEFAWATEGQVSVDVGQEANSLTQQQVQDLLALFTRVTLVATNNNDVPVGKVVVAECKLCGSLCRRDSAVLQRHALKHQRERRR